MKLSMIMLFLGISLATFLFGLGGCADPASSATALRKHGFTEIKTHGWSPMVCGQGDTFATKFTAKNVQGIRVSGTVCCGWIKNCTVRF